MHHEEIDVADLEVVEICAGAGGQALGLERAGFHHRLAVELDQNAVNTLEANKARDPKRASWDIRKGDVADPSIWTPSKSKGVDLLAGGVPCPPFTIAGKQLGATDERDLFAWAVELCEVVQPRALLLENVRGLSMPRFAGYRQHVLDRLREIKIDPLRDRELDQLQDTMGKAGYVAEWRLLQASDFGVPQLRPRFVLVALRHEYASHFHWPEPEGPPPTVGETLLQLMGSRGWEQAEEWASKADKIAPTIVGGSKKHGGADLGPTRAKRAWAEMGVDALGVADEPPPPGARYDVGPKLTCEMVALLQGFRPEWGWIFTGRKTARYRQIGNAFPPPVAKAIGKAIVKALNRKGDPANRNINTKGDQLYRLLRSGHYFTAAQIEEKIGLKPHELERRISLLRQDFHVDIRNGSSAVAYKLGEFKAFTGQEDHERHDLFLKHRAKIS